MGKFCNFEDCENRKPIRPLTSAGSHEALHVSALGPPQCQNAILSKQVQGQGIDSLLVDHQECFVIPLAHLHPNTADQPRSR